jgi:YidC/Oxa1 family membrane protein insertase
VVVGGPFLPLAIILYWFSNNIWTVGQQHYVFGMIEKEEEAKKREVIERRAANTPTPGAKPKRSPRKPASGNGVGTDDAAVDGDVASVERSKASTKKPNEAVRRNDQADRTPRQGAKPKKRRR